MFQIVFYGFSWEKKNMGWFPHSSFNFKTIDLGKNLFFFLSELQEEVKIKLGHDVEYILEDEGM